MRKIIRRIFTGKGNAVADFHDPIFGRFTFEKGLGWINQVFVGSMKVEVVLGSDGELPTNEMIQTLQELTSRWEAISSRISDFVDKELSKDEWNSEPGLPNSKSLMIASINVLWPEKPAVSFVEFSRVDGVDDERVWHMTFHGIDPIAFAFDH